MDFFSRKVVATLFFSTKTIFLRPKVLTEYFFCPFQRQNIIFNQICRQKWFSQKKHSPPPPTPTPYKLNGCSLRVFTNVCSSGCDCLYMFHILLGDCLYMFHRHLVILALRRVRVLNTNWFRTS